MSVFECYVSERNKCIRELCENLDENASYWLCIEYCSERADELCECEENDSEFQSVDDDLIEMYYGED